jgi:hypothetical protein
MQGIRSQSTPISAVSESLTDPREIFAPDAARSFPLFPHAKCAWGIQNTPTGQNTRLKRDRHTRAGVKHPPVPPLPHSDDPHLTGGVWRHCACFSCFEVGVRAVDPEQSQVFVPDGLKV